MSTRWLTALGRRLALPLAALAGSAASQQASAQTDPDAAAWEAARAAGTAAACQRYLEEFPEGRYVEEAFRCFVEAALPPAAPVAPRTAAPLVEPPRRPLAGPDAAAWEAARAAGTAAACQRYLEEFPEGRYVEEAFRCFVEAALPPAAPVAPRTAAPLVEPPRRPLAGPGDAGELFPFLLLPPIGPAIPPAEPVVPPAELY